MKEEIEEELEMLQSMYDESELEVNDNGILFRFKEKKKRVYVRFDFGEDYPDTLPTIEVTQANVKQDHQKVLLKELIRLGEELIGNAMLYDMITFTQQKLKELLKPKENMNKKNYDDDDEEEEIDNSAHFITIDQFLQWNKNFIAEKEAEEALKSERELKLISDKLTGKQFFLHREFKDDFEDDIDLTTDEDFPEIDPSLYDLSLIENELENFNENE
ncbi:hypothetical protein SNEBB_001781 [Seison nebaliae]|nr:hypothetical protein SNEBB_001781 [Seison nebaliae]